MSADFQISLPPWPMARVLKEASAHWNLLHPDNLKEVSVMAWIEDAEQKVLLVRQAVGLRLWTLPGGKVKRGESLVKTLRRELYEETDSST